MTSPWRELHQAGQHGGLRPRQRVRVIIDLGRGAGWENIPAPLTELGKPVGSVTDVVSHPEPSQTLHAVLLSNARCPGRLATYHRNQRAVNRADRFRTSPAIRLIETPNRVGSQLGTLAAAADRRARSVTCGIQATGPLGDPRPVPRPLPQAACWQIRHREPVLRRDLCNA